MAEASINKTFQFELVSPEKVLFSEESALVVVPGEAGDFGILADHAPVLSSLRPGVVVVTPASGEKRKIFVTGGFADVNDNVCSVLAEEAVNVSEFDKAVLEEQLKNLLDDQGFAGDDAVKKAKVQRDIALTKAKLQAIA